MSLAPRCSVENFTADNNFSGTHCPKPSAADAYTVIKTYSFTAGNVSPFTSNYTYNGTDGITANNVAVRSVNSQLISNVNNGVSHGCGPFTGVQITVTFHWGTGTLGPQYISFGRFAFADFNADSVSDTAYTYLKISPTVATTGIQAIRHASISAGTSGTDGPLGPVICTVNLGGNTTSTADQTVIFQFEQTSAFTARLRFSDGTNSFSSSDSGSYMGSGCGDGNAAGIYVAGSKIVTTESIFSGKTSTGPAAWFDSGPQTATVADRPLIKNIKIETRKVYPDFNGGNL